MTPEELSRMVAMALRTRGGDPPAPAQLRAAAEALGALTPLLSAFFAVRNPQLQMQLIDEMKDVLLRASAHLEEAKTLIATDPEAAFAPAAPPKNVEGGRG